MAERAPSLQRALDAWIDRGGTLVLCGRCGFAVNVQPGHPWPLACPSCFRLYLGPGGSQVSPGGLPKLG